METKVKSTKINAPDQQSYLLNKIPRDLWEMAQQKAKEQKPPLSMRWILICLLEKWVGTPTPTVAKATKASLVSKQVRRERKEKQSAPATPPPPVPPPAASLVPDLGDLF